MDTERPGGPDARQAGSAWTPGRPDGREPADGSADPPHTSGPGPQVQLARLVRAKLEDGPVWIPVSGASMAPTIVGGGRVEVIASRRRPRRGEVWAFVDPTGTIVVHRYRSADGGRMWFRGDGNPRDDLPVPAEAVIGRVAVVDDANGHRRIGPKDRLRGRVRLDAESVRRRLARRRARGTATS